MTITVSAPLHQSKQCMTINESQVCFIDPGIKIQKIQKEWPLIENVIKKYSYASNDWHNFIVFYMKMRLSHLNQTEPAEPPDIQQHPVAKRLVNIFRQKDSFQGIDEYLQENGFRKNPESRGWIFTTIYFDYVRQAYNNGYINMALREFLEGISREMHTEIPEIAAQKNYLILLQRYKLIK